MLSLVGTVNCCGLIHVRWNFNYEYICSMNIYWDKWTVIHALEKCLQEDPTQGIYTYFIPVFRFTCVVFLVSNVKSWIPFLTETNVWPGLIHTRNTGPYFFLLTTSLYNYNTEYSLNGPHSRYLLYKMTWKLLSVT